jgi:hypothetical protein
MGEIMGASIISGDLISLQTKHLVPYSLAYRLYTSLLKSLNSHSPQQIIENFRAQHLMINDTLLFVFSTLTENPFLSLDNLYKLKEFLTFINKDLKGEALLKKVSEVSYGMEDILNSIDPIARISKTSAFSISKPFQSLYSSVSNLIYMNKVWDPDGTAQTSAFVKAQNQLLLENQMSLISFRLPDCPSPPRPQIHPFAAQFIDAGSIPQMPSKKNSVKRIPENSKTTPLKYEKNPDGESCKLVIMVRKM